MYILKTLRVSEIAVKVYRDSEFPCYVVRLYIAGQERTEARYETEDKVDAMGTAIALFRQALEQRDEIAMAIQVFKSELLRS